MVPFCLVCLRELQHCILGHIFTILIFQLTIKNNLLAAFKVLQLEVPIDTMIFNLCVQGACYVHKCCDGIMSSLCGFPSSHLTSPVDYLMSFVWILGCLTEIFL